jgi:undecaprenyl-diphosphatase
MAILEWFNQIDTQMLMAVNEANSPFWDRFFTFFSLKQMWYPLYLLLILILFQKYRLKAIWLVLFFVLAIVVSDQLSGLLKMLTQRLRPSHEPALQGLLNLPSGKGGLYGFFSAHASNSFALAFLLGFVSRRKRIWSVFVLWALLASYSRVYLGVHYPFDVITGALAGALIGWGIYRLLMLFDFHLQRKALQLEGEWRKKHTRPLVIALVFIVITISVHAKYMERFF